jgi:hypothetical protein
LDDARELAVVDGDGADDLAARVFRGGMMYIVVVRWESNARRYDLVDYSRTQSSDPLKWVATKVNVAVGHR